MPPPRSPNWWSRNWLWFVPATIVSAILVIGALVLTGFALMRNSDVYQATIARAKASPTVKEALGDPLDEAYFFVGNIQLRNSSGWADMIIPVDGPKGKATIYTHATRKDRKWHFDRVIVVLDAGGRKIDLSDQAAPVELAKP